MTLVAAVLDGNIRYSEKHGLYWADMGVLGADGRIMRDDIITDDRSSKIITYRERTADTGYQRFINRMLPGYADMTRERRGLMARLAESLLDIYFTFTPDDYHEYPHGRIAIGGSSSDVDELSLIREQLAHQRMPFWPSVLYLRGKLGYTPIKPGKSGQHSQTKNKHSLILIYHDRQDGILAAGVGSVVEGANYLAIGGVRHRFKPERERHVIYPYRERYIHVQEGHNSGYRQLEGPLAELIKLTKSSLKLVANPNETDKTDVNIGVNWNHCLVAMDSRTQTNLMLNSDDDFTVEVIPWRPCSAGYVPHRQPQNFHPSMRYIRSW